MKIVYLEWVDAFSNSCWHTTDEINDFFKREFLIRQTGFLLKETKKYMVFAGAWKPKNGGCGEQFGDIHKIPKTWIRNRKTLKVIK